MTYVNALFYLFIQCDVVTLVISLSLSCVSVWCHWSCDRWCPVLFLCVITPHWLPRAWEDTAHDSEAPPTPQSFTAHTLTLGCRLCWPWHTDMEITPNPNDVPLITFIKKVPLSTSCIRRSDVVVQASYLCRDV